MNKKLIATLVGILCFILPGCTSKDVIQNQENVHDIQNAENSMIEGTTTEDVIQNQENVHDIQNAENSTIEETTTEEEKVITNRYIVRTNAPVTYTQKMEADLELDKQIGQYMTYETVTIENPNNEESINKINEVLDDWKIYIYDYEITTLPNDIEYFENFIYKYSEFYQNEKILVIQEMYSGASGGGAVNNSTEYYVFDKSTGNRLTLKDISNDADALMEYIFYKPTEMYSFDNYTNWWDIGLESYSLPKNSNDFKAYFEGTWTIDEKYITVSRSYAMSGPVFTAKYDLEDINDRLYKNIKDEYIHMEDFYEK